MKLTINLPKEIRIEEKQEKSNIPRIKWNEKNKTTFLNYMSLPCTLKKIKEIEELIDDESQVDVNEPLKQINEMYTISNKLLTRKATINKKNNKHRKKWYDSSCYELNRRLKLVCKLLCKSPNNSFLRGRFIQL